MSCSRCRGEDPNCYVCRSESARPPLTFRQLSDQRLNRIDELNRDSWPERSALARAELERRHA